MIRTRLLVGKEGTPGSTASYLLCSVGFCGGCHRQGNGTDDVCSLALCSYSYNLYLTAGWGARNRTQCLCCSPLNHLLFCCHLTGFCATKNGSNAMKMPTNGLHGVFAVCWLYVCVVGAGNLVVGS